MCELRFFRSLNIGMVGLSSYIPMNALASMAMGWSMLPESSSSSFRGSTFSNIYGNSAGVVDS